MNISKAKEQIRNTIRAYLTRDDLGNYVIPVEKQRPVLLIGPPGIGKTAIMEQLASELSIGLISYSMTHHTRQSAIGLPFISRKTYGGMEYDVTEYTMSEIIASVYGLMEETGVKEGILFLDEINCVSETLSPLMLQFLQYKVFGGHRVPGGWVIVTAGNPPEYNESAREFDAVTLDRLKKITVEPEFDAWKEYAVSAGMHPAVMSFLTNRRNCFYSVETTVNGRSIVTPRGWEDLSRILLLYEQNGLDADEDLMIQYLQNEKTAKEFSVYYDLFNKYRTGYPVGDILNGNFDEEAVKRASEAGFDEVYTLTGLLLSCAMNDVRARLAEFEVLESALSFLKDVRGDMEAGASASASIRKTVESLYKAREAGVRSHTLDRGESDRVLRTISLLEEIGADIGDGADTDEIMDTRAALDAIRQRFSEKTDEHSGKAEQTKEKINNLFRFADKCWGDGREMTMIAAELTADPAGAAFISRYGCEEYFNHNKELLYSEREAEIDRKLEELDI